MRTKTKTYSKKEPLEKFTVKEKFESEKIEDSDISSEAVIPEIPNDEDKKRGRRKKSEIEQEKFLEIQALITLMIQSTSAYLVSLGLSPVNQLQAVLIQTGCVGMCKKYNITSLDNYPEVTLGAGVLWTGYDKYQEYKILMSKRVKVKKEPDIDKDDNVNKDNNNGKQPV